MIDVNKTFLSNTIQSVENHNRREVGTLFENTVFYLVVKHQFMSNNCICNKLGGECVL